MLGLPAAAAPCRLMRNTASKARLETSTWPLTAVTLSGGAYGGNVAGTGPQGPDQAAEPAFTTTPGTRYWTGRSAASASE